MTEDTIRQVYCYDKETDKVSWRYPHLHRGSVPIRRRKLTRFGGGKPHDFYKSKHGQVSHAKIQQVFNPAKVVLA